MAGEIGDFMSIWNSIEIERMQSNQTAQLKMAEFRERVDALARETGVTPMGFFAYERANPTPQEHYSNKKWFGLAGGAFVGALFAMFSFGAAAPLIVGLAAGGFIWGAIFNAEPEPHRLNRALNRYDNYLTSMETVTRERARAQTIDFGGQGQHRTTHAQGVMDERAQAAQGPAQAAI